MRHAKVGVRATGIGSRDLDPFDVIQSIVGKKIVMGWGTRNDWDRNGT